MATTKNSTRKVSIKKVRTPKQENTDQKNVQDIKKRITKEKDLMYNYPEDCDNLDDRKKFRRIARAKNAQFHTKIGKAENQTEAAKLKKEAMTWAKEIYTKSHIPTF